MEISLRYRMSPIFAISALFPLQLLNISQTPPPAQQDLLEGTGVWDMAVVREHYKDIGLNIALQPAVFPNSATLNNVNQEFAKRVNVFFSIYQALNGNELCIVPGTGGLRTAKAQLDIFKECRRIRKVNGVAVGDGSQKAHYEEIPLAERTLANAPANKTVTDSWVSWHQLGMAVDLGYWLNGVYNNGDAPFSTAAFLTAAPYAQRLGLRFGYFWNKPDLGHIEWHPKLPDDPEAIPGLLNGNGRVGPGPATSGTALTDGQIDAGYKWKIPKQIFVDRYNTNEPNGQRTLEVWDLVKLDENWIGLKAVRVIVNSDSGNYWNGQWATFQPPLRFFPTYIATEELQRDANESTDYPATRVKSSVTILTYNKFDDGANHQKVEGFANFAPEFTVQNLWIKAWNQHWMHEQDAIMRNRWALLRQNIVYDLFVNVQLDSEINQDDLKATHTARYVDKDGYTTDTSSIETHPVVSPVPQLWFSWNRDTGVFGVDDIETLTPMAQPIELRMVRSNEEGGVQVVSGTRQGGSIDMAEPPRWPEARPKPPPPRRKT